MKENEGSKEAAGRDQAEKLSDEQLECVDGGTGDYGGPDEPGYCCVFCEDCRKEFWGVYSKVVAAHRNTPNCEWHHMYRM
jgi:hypothetical protein